MHALGCKRDHDERHAEGGDAEVLHGEARDLAAAQPAKAARLRARLEQWLKETNAQLPTPNPNYDPAREREPGAPMGPATAK